MSSIKKNVLSIFVWSLFVFNANAQSKVVHGKVTAFRDIPVELADVFIKKSKTTAFTDSLGGFKIECNIKDKITVKVAGFKTSTFKVKNLNDSIHINLQFSGEEGDIILAANKGHLHKRNIPKAIEYLKTPKPYSFGYNNMEALIKGKFPNVEIMNGVITMRGSNTFTGSNSALIVINGVQADWSTLNSLDITSIKKMEILKGPAAARYGSGGSNGVLYVQTISG
jgi:hypothetical protein